MDNAELYLRLTNITNDFNTEMNVILSALESSAPAPAVIVENNLQQALDNAKPGEILSLKRGTKFEGNFKVPPIEGLILKTDGFFPAERIKSSDGLACLISPNNSHALTVSQGAKNQTLSCFLMEGIQEVCRVGSGVETDETLQPCYITMDRLWINGKKDSFVTKRGLAAHGSNLSIIQCHIGNIKHNGQDSQAIYGCNGWGPYNIVDNYLEASGENILFGGDAPRIAGLIPSDILIKGNTLRKPLEWMVESSLDVKNLLEFKIGRRITIDYNIFDGCWVQNQAGYAILFTPKNHEGRVPQTIVENVLFCNNIIVNVSSAINISGDQSEYPTQRTTGMRITNNYAYVDSGAFHGAGRFMMIGRAPQNMEVSHNTTLCTGSSWIYSYKGGSVTQSQGCAFVDNMAYHQKYGFFGESGLKGNSCLTAYYPGAPFSGNVLAGGPASAYPKENYFPTVAEFEAEFTDQEGILNPDSKYRGKGVDWTKLPVFA